MDARRLLPILIGLLSITLVRCNHTASHSEGGQHTGGGNIISSKPSEVNTSLDEAIRLATEPDEKKNIFVQFVKLRSATAGLYPKRIFPNFVSNASEISGQYDSRVLQAFKVNQTTRLESGDCPQSLKTKHADASVSDLSLSANICFSVGNLTRVLPSVLLRELLSLTLHEAVHIGGGEEAEAVAWQEAFSKYFGERFGDVPSDAVVVDTLRDLSEIRLILSRAQGIAIGSPTDRRIATAIGKISERLLNLPLFDDPLALELKMQPKHPELINNYSNAVLALIENLKLTFEVRTDTIRVRSMRFDIDLLPPEQVSKVLNEFNASIDRISANFLALNSESADIQSQCVLPSNQMAIPGKPIINQSVYGPPQTCSGLATY